MKVRNLALALAAASALTVSAPSFAQADNTNSGVAPATTFDGWMTDHSRAHEGRISRQAYMDEMARRWDAADARRQGLSVEEINRTYGWSERDSTTGAITTPGYMGPKDVKK